MLPVLSRAEMQAADAAALASVSHQTLVRRAGTAAARTALDIMGGAYGRRVVVVAGKGSNGADARVLAEVVARRGAAVTTFEASSAPTVLPPCDLVVDGAYGTGFRGRYDAPTVPEGTPVLAIDIASGVDADTGEASGSAVRATDTVTFAAYKPGLLQGDGPASSGRVRVADIGIATGTPRVMLVEDADLALVPPRQRTAHKWSSAVGVAAGSPGMEGAAVLCARGAMAAGSGMVRLGSPGDPGASWPVEVVRLQLGGPGHGTGAEAAEWSTPFLDGASKCASIVVGPGLGTSASTAAQIRAVIAGAPGPVVVDADGLTALGSAAEARAVVAARAAPTVLTPHDGEFARLAGAAPGEDRIAAARDLAGRTGAVVLLKGPTTVVAAPPSAAVTTDVLVVASGSPALATAGTGDVLSGIIGAFLARGAPAPVGAALAAHVHGRAAGRGRREGLVSGDLPALVADVLSEVLHHG